MKSMKSRPRRRRLLAPGLNLTPLLDAILNLVFFFLLATQLKTNEAAMKVNLPSAESASDIAGAGETPTITVDSEGKTFFRDREIGDAELELEARRIAKDGASAVNIRGDQSANFGRIVEVMDICKRAGIREALINADKKGDAR